MEFVRNRQLFKDLDDYVNSQVAPSSDEVFLEKLERLVSNEGVESFDGEESRQFFDSEN